MKRTPAALTIAGFDPSGGAGVLADLRAFERAGAWGVAAVTTNTVQSTGAFSRHVPVSSGLLAEQLNLLASDVDVRAIKTGAMGSPGNLARVTAFVDRYPKVPLVVDPVLRPTHHPRSRLDGGASLRAWRELLSRAALITPNIVEAEVLLGETIVPGEERAAALALLSLGATAVLLKGGHGKGASSVDWFVSASETVALKRPRLRGARIRGTGCLLSALIAGRLARRASNLCSVRELLAASRWAKGVLFTAICRAHVVGSADRVVSFAMR